MLQYDLCIGASPKNTANRNPPKLFAKKQNPRRRETAPVPRMPEAVQREGDAEAAHGVAQRNEGAQVPPVQQGVQDEGRPVHTREEARAPQVRLPPVREALPSQEG